MTNQSPLTPEARLELFAEGRLLIEKLNERYDKPQVLEQDITTRKVDIMKLYGMIVKLLGDQPEGDAIISLFCLTEIEAGVTALPDVLQNDSAYMATVDDMLMDCESKLLRAFIYCTALTN